MKKFLSMLFAVVMAFSLAVPTFAATAVEEATIDAIFSKTEVNVGEEFTITIASEAKATYMEDMRFYFGDISYEEGNLANSTRNKFEIVSIADGDGYTEDHMFQLYISGSGNRAKYLPLTFTDKDAYFSFIGTDSGNFTTYTDESTVATITLKALEAGEYTFRLEEYSDYTEKEDDNGYNGIVKKEVVTVVDPNADTDKITVSNDNTDENGTAERNWTVTVPNAWLSEASDIVATFRAEGQTDDPHTLNKGNNTWSGEGNATINVKLINVRADIGKVSLKFDVGNERFGTSNGFDTNK